VTPRQAQELADLIDELASERGGEAVSEHEAINHDVPEPKNYTAELVARLAKLLESVHAG
jgi:hypothetical protein